MHYNRTYMKKTFIPILLFFISAFAINAQTIAPLFADMPDSLSPQLDAAWRKDLIELYQNGKEASLKNKLNGTSRIKQMTDDYLLAEISDRSTIQLKLLPLINDSKIICMVSTICAPICDSKVSFFSTDWKPIAMEDVLSPVTAEWFIKEGIDKNSFAFQDNMRWLDVDLIRYDLSADAPTLTATYTTPEYLSKDVREKIRPFLKEEPRVYTWKSHQFK